MTSRTTDVYVPATVLERGLVRYDSIVSTNSPIVNGRISFKQNTLTHRRQSIDLDPRPGYKDSSGRWVTNGGSYNGGAIATKYESYYYSKSLRADCDSKLRTRIGKISANIAMLFAERQKTADTVASRVMKLYRGARAIKKFRWREAYNIFGNPKRRLRLGKDFNRNWLEFQYGWKPVLADVYTLLDNPLPRVGGTAKASVRNDLSWQYRYNSTAQSTVGDSGCQQRGFSRIKVWVSGTAVNAISQTGLNNPLLIAWELVPYSFVVDWFFPIGSYLEGLGAYSGLTFEEYSFTQSNVITFSESQEWYQPPGFESRDTQHIWGRLSRKTRVVSGFVLNPFPSIGNGLNLTRFANGLALLAGLFGRKSPRST